MQNKPTRKIITIRELTEGFIDDGENGVVAYGGKLNVRPPYQREFIYKDSQRDEVINTVRNGFPLNTMYWSINNDGTMEVLDGQQRTISICQYVNGDYSINGMFFHNLPKDVRDEILNYEIDQLFTYSGTESEKLKWFKIVNTAGEKLTDQELRNSVYTGEWLSDAKAHFSKTGCVAYKIGESYMKGTPIRQDYLETALDWISKGNIEEYMAKHQHDKDAEELWNYFYDVIDWVNSLFPKYYSEMKGVNWGYLYNNYSNNNYDIDVLANKVITLMKDEDVTKKSGIFMYVFTNDESYLNIREFDNKTKREVYEMQKGICPICGKHFDISEMDADHIIPWSKGGKTTIENCQMLCKHCNRTKSNY